MACGAPVMDQENRHLAALGAADRIALEGSHLMVFMVYARGLDKPLKFIRRP